MEKRARGLTLRLALLGSFGLTVGLWLFAGYLVSQRIARAERESAMLDARYLQAQERLSLVRTQVLLASVIVRDALLDPAPRPPSDYRRDVEQAYRVIDAALEDYFPLYEVRPHDDRVDRLRAEIDAFRVASLGILATDRRTWQADARVLLRRVLPKREAVLAVSDELQAINRMAYVGQQDDAAEVQTALQKQVLTVLGMALAVSLLIAGLVVRYSVRLERSLVHQRLHEEQLAADLQRLSAHVVKVQEDERRRIARDLHDEVGQALSAVGLELANAQKRLGTAVLGNILADARALTDGALRTVRDISQLLHPSVLEDLGLVAALQSYFTGFGRRSGIRVEFREEGLPEFMPPGVERAAYRIVQEALTNVARHAHAHRVVVRLTTSKGRLLVSVEDDGVGFDAADVQRPGRSCGLGLLSIRERLLQMDGVLRLDSQPGRGTRLEAHFPLGVKNAAEGRRDGHTPAFVPHEVPHG